MRLIWGEVSHIGVFALNLSSSSDLDALGQGPARLHFRHVGILLFFLRCQDGLIPFFFPIRGFINGRNIRKESDKFTHHVFTDFFVGELATFEDHADLHFVSVFQEFTGFARFGLNIVFPNDGAQLDLFQLADVLVFASLAFLLLLLKAEFSVVEDFADVGNGVRRDAIEVKILSRGQVIGGAARHDAQLFAISSDDSHFRIMDVLIDRIITFLGTAVIIRIEVRDGICPP